MKTVLSTKILTPSQKELFLNSGIGLVEYNALKIRFLDFKILEEYSNYIFTSKNAAKSFLKEIGGLDKSKSHAFCVGEKTKRFLEENGLKVVKMAENATQLADFIVENHQNEAFLFFCGNLRREELPSVLSENNVRYTEIEAYRTDLVPKKFDRLFEGVLFFSPSGIKSYLTNNSISKSMVFSIGPTTTAEAQKHTTSIITAKKPTVENVLVQAINYFRTND